MNSQGWFQSVTWLHEPVNTQPLTSFPNTHNNPSTHLSSTQIAPPKRMDPHPSLSRSPSSSPSPSRAPMQLVQNIHAGNLRTHSCEKIWTHANASQKCKPQVMARLHQRPLQQKILWILFRISFSFPQTKTRMRKYEWVTEMNGLRSPHKVRNNEQSS
jgi:hypothetical protein